ncbi:hypothetical protein RF11_00740 [Thelohanellus kitauei]|uniref:Uncharacterized protein n=1 Tax=Thelohanellus kitauei TaxID=669202 RepID=A0A0C2NEC5_THEKT|nr:hypothetical protein RF11_00740 [Thelohanellus kitauei]
MSNNGHRHNPGSLKQQNKKHKHGVHRSKHQLNKFGKRKNLNHLENTTKVHHKIVVKSKKDRQNERLQHRINKTPLSDKAISRRFIDTHSEIELNIMSKMSDEFFALQVDSNAEIGGKEELVKLLYKTFCDEIVARNNRQAKHI